MGDRLDLENVKRVAKSRVAIWAANLRYHHLFMRICQYDEVSWNLLMRKTNRLSDTFQSLLIFSAFFSNPAIIHVLIVSLTLIPT